MKTLGTVLISLFVLTNSCFCQTIAKAGDGWDLKVDSALRLIKTVDSSKYVVIKDVCQRIDFWKSSFSSTGVVEGDYTILVADADIKLNSINNLAAVLVHESLHLMFVLEDAVMSEREEEFRCYLYELSFIKNIPTPEPWLLANIYEKLQKYKP
jgi:hypothetical protein